MIEALTVDSSEFLPNKHPAGNMIRFVPIKIPTLGSEPIGARWWYPDSQLVDPGKPDYTKLSLYPKVQGAILEALFLGNIDFNRYPCMPKLHATGYSLRGEKAVIFPTKITTTPEDHLINTYTELMESGAKSIEPINVVSEIKIGSGSDEQPKEGYFYEPGYYIGSLTTEPHGEGIYRKGLIKYLEFLLSMQDKGFWPADFTFNSTCLINPEGDITIIDTGGEHLVRGSAALGSLQKVYKSLLDHELDKRHASAEDRQTQEKNFDRMMWLVQDPPTLHDLHTILMSAEVDTWAYEQIRTSNDPKGEIDHGLKEIMTWRDNPTLISDPERGIIDIRHDLSWIIGY